MTFSTDLRLGGPGDETVLWVASMYGHVRPIELLLQSGLNVNVDGGWLQKE